MSKPHPSKKNATAVGAAPDLLKQPYSRRHFLRTTFACGAGLLILPNSRTAFAYEANSKLNVAAIGVGGRGRGSIAVAAKQGENIVALCDVDRQEWSPQRGSAQLMGPEGIEPSTKGL